MFMKWANKTISASCPKSRVVYVLQHLETRQHTELRFGNLAGKFLDHHQEQPIAQLQNYSY